MTEGAVARGVTTVAHWLAGSTTTATTEEQFKQNMVAIAELNGSSRSFNSFNSNSEHLPAGIYTNHKRREELLQEWTTKLEQQQDENMTVSLTVKDLRLLLGIFLPDEDNKKEKQQEEEKPNKTSLIQNMKENTSAEAKNNGDESNNNNNSNNTNTNTYTNSSSNNTKRMSYSHWDFTSFFGSSSDDGEDDTLTPDEIQAITIALAAEEEQQRNNNSYNNNYNSLTAAARQVSIQTNYDATEKGGTEIVVTLGGGRSSANLEDPTKDNSSNKNKNKNDTNINNSAIASRPNQMATRQVSIQHGNSNNNNKDVKPTQLNLENREASIRLSDDLQSSFIVTFPADHRNAWWPENTTATTSSSTSRRRPSSGIRQISVQPRKPTTLTDNANQQQEAEGESCRPGGISQRQVSVSLNGAEPISFQVAI